MSPVPTENVWLIQIRSFFEQEEEDDIDKPASIYNVPKALKIIKPEAYTPQMIALGPYHHWREDLYEMERYKLIAAKRVQVLFKSLKFQDLVDKLAKAEFKIRACYHKYLIMDVETLSWMMAIDGLFLLQFLHIFVNRSESVLANSARMSFLVDLKGRKLGYDSVLKDIMMLENQIPILVMKRILRIQCSSTELADTLLPPMFLAICKEIAPLKLIDEDFPLSNVLQCAHLLDLLYQLMVPKCEEPQDDPHKVSKKFEVDGMVNPIKGCYSHVSSNIGQATKVFKDLWGKISHLGVMQKLKSGPLKLVTAFEPIISKFAPQLFKGKEGNENSGDSKDVLKVEEIMIPSVTNLRDQGVTFCPTYGGINTLKFDGKYKVLHLPVVNLDVNSEVIVRNLVAYEASAVSGPLVFARYTELMNGIVDTAEDAKILAQLNNIKSEFGYEEVATLWNGMSKSIRLSRVDFIDETIKGVNAYFFSTKKVRFYLAARTYVYGSWRMVVLLASLLIIGLMCIQSFCTVYNCPRTFNLEPVSAKG